VVSRKDNYSEGVVHTKLLLFVTVTFLIACSHEKTSIPLPTAEETEVNSQKPEVGSGGNFLNQEGWQTPVAGSATITEKKKFLGTTASGKTANVTSITYGLSQPILSRDTSKAVNKDNEQSVRIWSFTEWRVNSRVFCYQFRAQPLTTGTNTGLGVNFFYKICDQDGDSKFETLSFERAVRTLPDWVAE